MYVCMYMLVKSQPLNQPGGGVPIARSGKKQKGTKKTAGRTKLQRLVDSPSGGRMVAMSLWLPYICKYTH